MNAKIIGVSRDSQDTNLKFAEENGIAFALVSDKDSAIRKKYGRGRVTYLIDRRGVIRWIQKGVPDNQAFLKKLREIQQNAKP